MTNVQVRLNPIDVVEAAYNLEADDREWLDGLAVRIRPLLETGAGMVAYTFDAAIPPTRWSDNALLYGVDRAELPKYTGIQFAEPELARIAHFAFEGLLGLVEMGFKAGLGDVRDKPLLGDLFEHLGVEDFAALQTVEPGRKGVLFAAGQRHRRSWDRRTRRLWARVNVHIAAGRRLRAALSGQGAVEEAVLRPDGRVEHAEGDCTSQPVRELLRDAVARQEAARGKQRRTDPEGATEVWTALVSGRWSLVDRFERNGRRYIVARRNEHALPDPRALTPRERTVAQLATLGKPNKLIAYELGISDSSVGSHLSSAMRKLGVKSRVDLIRLVTQLGMPQPL